MTNQTVKQFLDGLLSFYNRPFRTLPRVEQTTLARKIINEWDIGADIFSDRKGDAELQKMMKLVTKGDHAEAGRLLENLMIEQSEAQRIYDEALEAFRDCIESPENQSALAADRLNDVIVDIARTR